MSSFFLSPEPPICTITIDVLQKIKKELCFDTVRQLRHSGELRKSAILHSDRGSQYTSAAFKKELVRCGLVQSLSGVGHCFDNARMESFFATLKKEKLYRLPISSMTRAEVRTVIFRYIFGYYNTQRVTSFNPGGLPPTTFRQLKAGKPTAA